MNNLLPFIDSLFGPTFQQKKTEIAAITFGIVNGVNQVVEAVFQIGLPDNVLNIINGGLAIAIVLFMGSRVARTENAVNAVAANQPTGPATTQPTPSTTTTGASS